MARSDSVASGFSRTFDAAGVCAPLVIGVTGHRDLRNEDVPALEACVREILSELKKPDDPTPLTLLSPLAEGADQLVARVATIEFGATLIVPLPMPKAAYIASFESQESVAEFERLLSRAAHWFEIPGASATAGDLAYQNLGQYLARRSQVLIALWDGVKPGRTGGTAQVVDYQLEGTPSERPNDLEPADGFPVHHIWTPHGDVSLPEGRTISWQRLYPSAFKDDDARAKAYYDKMFGRLKEFNERLVQGGDRLATEALKSRDRILGEEKVRDLSLEHDRMLSRYAFVDAMALAAKRNIVRVQRQLHVLIFLAFVFFILFAHGKGHPPLWLVPSFISLLCAYGIYKSAVRDGLDTSYQDYRAVTEGLRVGFFWALAGVDENVADNYMREQRTELDWIRNGLRGWYLTSEPEADRKRASPVDGLALARDHWVDRQHTWFSKTKAGEEEHLHWLKWYAHNAIKATFVLCALLGVTLAAKPYAPPLREFLHHHEYLVTWWIILIDVILACGALLHHYIERMAYAEHVKQYGRIASIFKYVLDQLESDACKRDPNRARELLRSLGKEALTENGDWVLLHRERPLEMPHP